MSIYDEVKPVAFGDQHAHVMPDTTLEEFEVECKRLAILQRGVLWWIGDVALALERQHPTYHYQAWPEWVSPDLIERCKAVSRAYAPDDRNIDATWTIHMKMANRGDRVQAVQDSVEMGQTSDEARKSPPPPREPEKPVEPVKAEPQTPAAVSNAWLLAVDVNYFIHRYYHSGSGVEAASTFVAWLVRLIKRLVETKGLTDVVCCLDAPTNHRKALTEKWEHKYKPRSEKEEELSSQLKLAPQMLKKLNLPVISIDDMEADDVIASYAFKFDGRGTMLTQDKDMRQCLHPRRMRLIEVTCEEHPETNQAVPVYKWVSAKTHLEEGVTYNGVKVTGISPEQWPHFQAIAGDSTDGIKGCEGIGAKVAMKLIQEHGTVQRVIAACKDNKADLSEIKRLAVLDFEEVAETMLKLTTLRRDLPVPQTTKLCMKEDES